METGGRAEPTSSGEVSPLRWRHISPHADMRGRSGWRAAGARRCGDIATCRKQDSAQASALPVPAGYLLIPPDVCFACRYTTELRSSVFSVPPQQVSGGQKWKNFHNLTRGGSTRKALSLAGFAANRHKQVVADWVIGKSQYGSQKAYRSLPACFGAGHILAQLIHRLAP